MRKEEDCLWTEDELWYAIGDRNPEAVMQACDVPVVTHELSLVSAFCDVAGHEPLYTTWHDQYAGTVDYMFYSPSGVLAAGGVRGPESGKQGVFMRACATLGPRPIWGPPSAALGLPSPLEGSDHVCLVTDFVFGWR